MSTGVQATRTGGGPQRRPRTFTRGRVCATEGCNTVISRYNSSEHCFTHAPPKFRRLRGVIAEER